MATTLPGRSQPQPPAGMPLLGAAGLVVGVGDRLEVAKDPPQPGWVQPTGRLDQDWFGLHGDRLGQRLDAAG